MNSQEKHIHQGGLLVVAQPVFWGSATDVHNGGQMLCIIGISGFHSHGFIRGWYSVQREGKAARGRAAADHVGCCVLCVVFCGGSLSTCSYCSCREFIWSRPTWPIFVQS
jgi:hypothetical protein